MIRGAFTMRSMTGKELIKLRESHAMSQVALAEELVIDRSTISKWETGAIEIPPSRAKMIRLVLKGAA